MFALSFLLAEAADESGLVAIGGDLHPQRLLQAYRSGVFPWYGEGEPICWWSPDPRAVFELDGLHIPRRLARTLRSPRYRVTINQDFGAVIRGCKEGREDGTWITPEMIEAYERLHHLGHAHSVEVWERDALVGGLYGVAVGGLFAGESMFTRGRDGSKIALVHTMQRLRERGFALFDIQMLTPHTARLGAVDIPRSEYLARLRKALRLSAAFA